jgi:hypothetical protein
MLFPSLDLRYQGPRTPTSISCAPQQQPVCSDRTLGYDNPRKIHYAAYCTSSPDSPLFLKSSTFVKKIIRSLLLAGSPERSEDIETKFMGFISPLLYSMFSTVENLTRSCDRDRYSNINLSVLCLPFLPLFSRFFSRHWLRPKRSGIVRYDGGRSSSRRLSSG